MIAKNLSIAIYFLRYIIYLFIIYILIIYLLFINYHGLILLQLSKNFISVLEHFVLRPPKKLIIEEGKSLTIPCIAPHGTPPPTVFWLYRDALQTSVIETIRRNHITVDEEGMLFFE